LAIEYAHWRSARSWSVRRQQEYSAYCQQSKSEGFVTCDLSSKPETAEAQFAKALDRLQPRLLHTVTNDGTWTENNVNEDQVYKWSHHCSWVG